MKDIPMQTQVKNRIIAAGFILITAFTLVSSHLVTVQLVQHEKWLERAEADYARRIVLPARRGYIFDRNGEQLAHNRPVVNLVADRYQMEDYTVMLHGVAAARGKDFKEIKRLYSKRTPENIESLRVEYMNHVARVLADHLPGGVDVVRASMEFGKRQRLVLAEQLSLEDMQRMKVDLAARMVDGLRFEDGMGRFYPNGQGLCHVLGFVDSDNKGCEGVEANMDGWLAGQDGYREMMVDRRGRQVPAYHAREVAPRHGANVHLTVNYGLQRIVEEELGKAQEEFLYKRAAVVLMDPSNGDILALANVPKFDPNTREGERRNFAFSDVYEPGSTFKIVAATAALDLGEVTPKTTIFCHNGHYSEGAVRITDHHGYGDLTVAGILEKSSNIGAFKLARMVGMDRYYEYVGRFGFGQVTGLGLTAETPGVVRQNRNIVDFSRCAYGYSVSVTPVQLATAYAAIANGGMLLRPRVVRQVTDCEGKVLWENPVDTRHRVASAKACNQVIAGLRDVVDLKGTGKRAQVPGFNVAGKTGTAHLWNPQKKEYDKERPVCSFAGFLPAESPKLVCVVVCSEPEAKIERYGGTIAAPVFARIAARAMDQMGVEPDMPMPETADAGNDP